MTLLPFIVQPNAIKFTFLAEFLPAVPGLPVRIFFLAMLAPEWDQRLGFLVTIRKNVSFLIVTVYIHRSGSSQVNSHQDLLE